MLYFWCAWSRISVTNEPTEYEIWDECVPLYTLSNCHGSLFPFLCHGVLQSWSGRITLLVKGDFKIHVNLVFHIFAVDPIDVALLELRFINIMNILCIKWDHDFFYVQAKNMKYVSEKSRRLGAGWDPCTPVECLWAKMVVVKLWQAKFVCFFRLA